MTTPPVKYVYVDSETTSLDTRLGDVIEAAWAVNLAPIKSCVFPHSLNHANPEALRINRYFERDLDLYCTDFDRDVDPKGDHPNSLIRELLGATIVAENYGFDVAMLLRKLGFEPWHYRKIELSSVAMSVFNLDAPESQSRTADRLRDLGYIIPESDHSATNDVACLRAAHLALRDVRSRHGYPASLKAAGV